MVAELLYQRETLTLDILGRMTRGQIYGLLARPRDGDGKLIRQRTRDAEEAPLPRPKDLRIPPECFTMERHSRYSGDLQKPSAEWVATWWLHKRIHQPTQGWSDADLLGLFARELKDA